MSAAGDETVQPLKLQFGIEEEFRNQEMRWLMRKLKFYESMEEAQKDARDLHRKTLLELCAREAEIKCFEDFHQDGRPRVGFKDRNGKFLGWVDSKLDSMVLELRAQPFALEDLKGDFGKALNLSVFQATKVAKLKRTILGGEGHVHIDFKSLFGGYPGEALDYRFFRNYLVDWANHNELYNGALHYDRLGPSPARPILENPESREKFKKWLSDFDATLEKGSMTPVLFKEKWKDLARDFSYEKGSGSEFSKGSAINLFTTTDKATIEVRTLRPKKNMKTLEQVLQLLESRANFVKKVQGNLQYHGSGPIHSAQDGVNRFYRYIQEAGLDWKEYRKIMPAYWRLFTPKKLPDEKLFRANPAAKASWRLRCINNVLIHIFGI